MDPRLVLVVVLNVGPLDLSHSSPTSPSHHGGTSNLVPCPPTAILQIISEENLNMSNQAILGSQIRHDVFSCITSILTSSLPWTHLHSSSLLPYLSCCLTGTTTDSWSLSVGTVRSILWYSQVILWYKVRATFQSHTQVVTFQLVKRQVTFHRYNQANRFLRRFHCINPFLSTQE